MYSRKWLIAITLLSTFALGANLSSAMHECGHALGCWIGGGHVTGFVLRPFDFSHVGTNMGSRPPWSNMLMSGGGILFGILFALPLIPLSGRFRRGSVVWLILFMTLTMALGLNGVLLVQSVATGAGDPAALLAYGTAGYGIPNAVMRILFAIVGIPVLVVFVRLMLNLLRVFGPAPGDSYVGWVATVEAGFIPYFFLMTAHTAYFGDRATLFRQILSFYIPFIALLALLVLIAATWVFRTAGATKKGAAAAGPPSVSKAMVLFGLAVALICGELALTAGA